VPAIDAGEQQIVAAFVFTAGSEIRQQELGQGHRAVLVRLRGPHDDLRTDLYCVLSNSGPPPQHVPFRRGQLADLLMSHIDVALTAIARQFDTARRIAAQQMV